MTGRTARGIPLGLAVAVVLAGVTPVSAAFAAPAAVRAAAPLPGGLGPCVPGDCPQTWPEPNNMDPTGTDNAVNVFVGGDFRVRERAAEAEGKVVVMGGFDMAKAAAASSVYNIGIVGVGSQVRPPAGSDFLATGGNVSVAPNQTLLADGGVVRYAGTLTGNVTGTKIPDANAVARYRGLREELTAASKCYARVDGRPRPATGTVENLGYETLFTGDGAASLQVFNVTGNLAGRGDVQQSLRFANIPANATVLVNVLGTAPIVNTSSGVLAGVSRDRLLWNFPDAATVRLIGTGQFQGATLIAEPGSETTVQLPGMNGRFFTSGSLTHTSAATGGGGQEFHSYPFNGDLPACGGLPPVTGDVSVLKVDSESDEVLPGAVFELWKETNGTPGLQTGATGGDTKVDDCTTPATGVCSSSQALGTYYWRETAPPAGHDLPSDPVFGPLVLTAENASAGVSVRAANTATVVPPPTGTVSVRKVDSETGEALPGAVFELWKETNGTAGLQPIGINADTKIGDDCTTPADGTCTRTVPVGTYYWRETTPPAGHDLPANPVFGPLVLTERNLAVGVEVTAPNEKTTKPPKPPYTGGIKVVKKDAKTGRPLRGAVFDVWRETNGVAGLQTTGNRRDRLVEPGCATDRHGTCTFDGLPEGDYYLRETDVPEGYVLPPRPVIGPLPVSRHNEERWLTVHVKNKRTEHGKGKDEHGRGEHGEGEHGEGEHGEGEHGHDGQEGDHEDGPEGGHEDGPEDGGWRGHRP
ncbi:choice-of-anchor A family protein [Streptomyces sp. NBC_00239]|uniref:choice-of-anchor A family protein n=1 Tax=Streptomyces sp. NBC_00239 TaxID=2903640 RepID=UPI002E2AAB77|nr:choice-of-anchor A family protein [Streptomyces sp. NBC_00239]